MELRKSAIGVPTSFEQGQETVGGECGGKAAGQREHSFVPHVPDTVRESRVPGAEGGAVSSVSFSPPCVRHKSRMR